MVCWTCGKKGYIALFCRSRTSEQHQENFRPSVERACQREGRLPAEAQTGPLTVASLSVTCGVSYRVKGVVGVVDIEFVVDTGAAVSLICHPNQLPIQPLYNKFFVVSKSCTSIYFQLTSPVKDPSFSPIHCASLDL